MFLSFYRALFGVSDFLLAHFNQNRCLLALGEHRYYQVYQPLKIFKPGFRLTLFSLETQTMSSPFKT